MIQGCCRNVRRVRTDPVEMHYSRGNLMELIDVGLAESGLDPQHLDADTLAPIEEFHTFGTSRDRRARRCRRALQGGPRARRRERDRWCGAS